ncbi:hypothetical protein RBB50_000534 [Rhinocladiella similis]
MHIQNIPREYVSVLTKILQFPPNVDVREHIKSLASLIKPLPYTLRTSRVERVILRHQGNLCSVHNFLDCETVETILCKIKVEIGSRLNSLVSQCQLLTPEQRTCITGLRQLHALWTPRGEFEMTFMCCADDIKWKYETSQCEACIISRIAGDLQTMLNLRCIVRSRATSKHIEKHGLPRLQAWIAGWIEHLRHHLAKTGQIMDLEKVIAENEEAAAALKRARGKIHEFRTKQHGIIHVDSWKHGEHSRTGNSTVRPAKEEADAETVVSADPSSKGQSPYGGRVSLMRAKSETVYSVDLENLGAGPSVVQQCEIGEQEQEPEQEPYIPPRQNWTKVPVPPTIPRSVAQSNPPAPTCRDSWETEPLASTQVSQAVSTPYPHPQQYAARPLQPRAGPAETYEKLIGSFPADSVAEIIELYDDEEQSSEPTLETLPQTTYSPHQNPHLHPQSHSHSHSDRQAPPPSPAVYKHTHPQPATDSNASFNKLGQGSAAATAIFILDESCTSTSTGSGPPAPPHQQPSTCSSSRWEDFYESQTRLRDDLNWFYRSQRT